MPRRRPALAGLAALAVLAATLAAPGPAAADGVAVPPFSLRSVDATCFYAPRPAGGWPFRPQTQIRPIRGGFNDARTPAHDGIDVEAPADGAAVYAISAGTVANETPRSRPNGGTHMDVVDSTGHAYTYWHIVWPVALVDGVHVKRGQLIGHIDHGFWHVHVSETVPGCWLVDPRRPTGVFHDPADTEAPAIGALHAFVADADAFGFTLGATGDPSTALPLNGLNGVVDMRASVTDTPRDATRQFVQLPLSPAAVRGYLAPAGAPASHLGPIAVYDGARFILSSYASPLDYQRWWAFGTMHENACFFGGTTCAADYVYHTADAGFDTRQVADGSYLWCVEALTIAGTDARRCTPVVIANGG
jgi:hypothetical protein